MLYYYPHFISKQVRANKVKYFAQGGIAKKEELGFKLSLYTTLSKDLHLSQNTNFLKLQSHEYDKLAFLLLLPVKHYKTNGEGQYSCY
jgi:hypothetical protein